MNVVKDKDESIVTFRPDGRKGTAMLKSHYNKMSAYILSLLDTEESITLNDLLESAQRNFSDSIDSDVAWYVLQVKLDLEARDLIRVVTAPYNKRIFFLRITRQGQKKIRLERQIEEWSAADSAFED